MREDLLKDTTWRVVFHAITSTFYSTILFTIITNKYVILIERMITSWYLALHMLFVFFRLFQDVINFTRVRDWRLNILLTKFINLLFISIIFPYAMYIPTVYWLLFYYNSNLIHPNFLDVSLASWVSTSSHSVIAIVAFVEMFTSKYSYKGNYIGAIILLVAFTVAYAACLIGTYLQYGFWLYPVFHLFSSQTLFYVFTLLGILLLFMFLLGKILADFVNGKKFQFFNKLISHIKSILPRKYFGDKELNVENSKIEKKSEQTVKENNIYCEPEGVRRLSTVQEDNLEKKYNLGAKIVEGKLEPEFKEVAIMNRSGSLDVEEDTAVKEYDLCDERKSELSVKEAIINREPECKEVTFNFDKDPEQSRKASNSTEMAFEQELYHSNQYECDKKVIEEPKNESADCDMICQSEEIQCESSSENIDINSDSSMSSADISVMNCCKNSHSSDGKSTYGVCGSEGEMAVEMHQKILMKTSSEENDQYNKKYPQKPFRMRLKFPSDSSCNEEIRKNSRKGMKTKNPDSDERSHCSDNVEVHLKIKQKDKSFLEKMLNRNKKYEKSNNCSKSKTISLEILQISGEIHSRNNTSSHSQNKENVGITKSMETLNEHVQYENVVKKKSCASLKIDNHIEKTKPSFVKNQQSNTSYTIINTPQNDSNVPTISNKSVRFEKVKKSDLKQNKPEEKSKRQYFLFNAFLRKPKSKEKSCIENNPERDGQGEKKQKHCKKDNHKKEHESERKRNSENKTNEIRTTEIKNHNCVAHKYVEKMESFHEPLQQGRSSNQHRKKRRSKRKRTNQISSPNEKIIQRTDSDSANEALQKNRPKRKKRRSRQQFSTLNSEKPHSGDENQNVTEINGKSVNECENMGEKSSERNRSGEGDDQCRKNDIRIGRTLKRRIMERIFNSSKGKEKNTGTGTPLDSKNSLEPQFEAVFSIFPRNNQKLSIDSDAEKVLESLKITNSSNVRVKPCNFYATVSCHPLLPSKQEMK